MFNVPFLLKESAWVSGSWEVSSVKILCKEARCDRAPL